MRFAPTGQTFGESTIEEEPILGVVLVMRDGRIQPLTWLERLLVKLRLADAKGLEERYLKLAKV